LPIIIPTYNEGHISGQINQMRFEKGISILDGKKKL